MKRRSFLQILGLGAVSTVLPVKAEPKIDYDPLRFTDEELKAVKSGRTMHDMTSKDMQALKAVANRSAIWDDKVFMEYVKENQYATYIGKNS
ncbi:MAG: hypothetical protein V3T88_07900 [Nitrosomonadaceae bacterium]